MTFDPTEKVYNETGYYIAQGKHPTTQSYRKFGRIDAIQLAVPADCWEYGITVGAERYTFSTTAAIDTMSSSNAGDTELITITGLTLDGTEVEQELALTGQAKVTLTTPLYRVNRAFNSNGTDLLGNVYVYEDTPIVAGVPTLKSMVRAYIAIGRQQTLQGIYTVPKGKTAYLMALKTSLGGRKSGFATYEAFLRIPGKVFRVQDTHDLAAEGTSSISESFDDPSEFPELTDFVPKITVSANGIGFSISFRLRLVDNE